MTSINVRPGIESSHDIAVSDGVETWGFRLDGGVAGIQEVSASPSTLKFTPSGSKWGDFEPYMTHVEQRTWEGGRANEDFADDATKFYDSMNLWSVTPGYLLPAPQWKFSTGLRDADAHLPGNVTWRGVHGTQRYHDVLFAASASYNLKKAYVWLRRVGTPGTLTLALHADNAGAPGDLLKSATVTTTTITDVVSVFRVFEWEAAQAVVAETNYHVLVYGAATDNVANHWEIGVDADTSGGLVSADGSAWTSAGWKMYFRTTDADVDNKWHLFRIGTDVLAVSQPATGTSKIKVLSGTAWTDITPGSGDTLNGIVTSVAVYNNIAHLAQTGTNAYILKVRKNGSNWEFDYDGTNTASVLCVHYDPTDGLQLWRAKNDTVATSKSAKKAWGEAHTFDTELVIGDTGSAITAMRSFDDKVYVRKTDSLWSVSVGKAYQENVGLDAVIDDQSVMTDQNLFLYMTWSHSIERLYNGTMDDVGPWRHAGMPPVRAGVVSCLLPVIGWMFAGVDAGASGTSSVLMWDERGWHEIFRAWEVGKRVRNVYYQSSNASRGRLWISVGGELVYQDFPLNTLNPVKDTGMRYQHEAVLETAAFDLGYADLPKFFKDLTAVTRNLSTDIYIGVDYQDDIDIGTNNWYPLEDLVQSPKDTVKINLGRKKTIRFRLRLNTNRADIPPIIRATVLKGFARTPTKRMWNMKIKVGSLQTTRTGEVDRNPNDFYRWLWSSCQDAAGVRMMASWESIHDTWVVIEPPSLIRSALIRVTGWWSGTFMVTLREL